MLTLSYSLGSPYLCYVQASLFITKLSKSTIPWIQNNFCLVSCRHMGFKEKDIGQLAIRPQSTFTASQAPLSAATYSAGDIVRYHCPPTADYNDRLEHIIFNFQLYHACYAFVPSL